MKERTKRYREQKAALLKKRRVRVKRLAKARKANFLRWEASEMEKIL